MNEDYIDDLYKNITSKDESFSGKFTPESFREKISTNPAYAARMHTWLSGVDEDFELSVDRFIEEVSTTVDPPVKKKSGMESSSADGSVDSPFTTLDEPYLDKPRVEKPKEKTEKEIADFKKFYEKVPEEQALEEVGISAEEAAAADAATFPEYEKFGQPDATTLDVPMGQPLMEEEVSVAEGLSIQKEQQKEYFERKESGEDVNYLYNEILYKEEIEAEKEKIKEEEERKSKGYTSIELKAIDDYSKINPGRIYEDDMSLYDEYEELTDFIRFIDDYRKNPYKKNSFEDLTDKEKKKYGPKLYYNGKISLNIDQIYNKLDNEREKLSDEYLDDDTELARENYDQSVIRENKKRIDKAVSIKNKANETLTELDVISNNRFGFGYKELIKYTPKTKEEAESQANIIKKLIEVNEQSQIAADIYENSKLYFSTRFDTENNLELVDNLDSVITSFNSAEAQGKAGEYLMQLSLGMIPDDEESVFEVATNISKLLSKSPEKKSRAMKRWEQSYGGTAGLDVFLDNPIELMTSLAASSISQMLPLGMKIIPAGIAAGAATGAKAYAAGPLAGTAGVLSGGATGLILSQAAVQAAMEYTNEVLESVKFFGYKVTEPQSLAMALQDQRVWDRGLQRGGTRGAVIALADVLSGGTAGKILKVGSLASRGKRVAAAVTERLFIDPAFEGAGELFAQLSVGDDLDMKAIAEETAGSAGAKQVNAMINVANQTRAKNRIDLANKLTDINFISQELSSDKKITDWANNMQRLGQISPETNQRIQKNVGLRRDAKEISVIAGLAKKNKKVRARIMTLLAAKEDLSSSLNRKSVFGEKIKEIDSELASTVETGKLLPQEEQVVLAGQGLIPATEQASATDIREALPEYKIKKGIRGRVVPVTKNEFLKAVEKSDYNELAKLNAKVINDDDTKRILDNKIKKGVEENEISEIESNRAKDLANDVNNEDTEAINNYHDNEIEKVKYKYGIQEQSTETVDAPKPAEGSPKMGGTVPPTGTFTEPAESQVDKTEQQVEEEKAEIIETFFEGEPSEDVNKVSGNLSINKTGEGTQKKSRFRNRVKSIAVKAAKSISKIIPDTKIILHESNDEYVKYVPDAQGDTERAEYNPVQNIIHVNLSNATISTLPHEVFHAVLLNRVKTDEAAQKITKKMVDSVRKTLPDNNELAIAIDKFAAKYKGKREQLQDEERISELIGLLASKEFGYSTLSKPAKNSIIEFFKNLANRFGIKLGTDFGKTDESVIDLINTIAKKTVEGEVIEPSEIRAIEELNQEQGEEGGRYMKNPSSVLSRKQVGDFEVSYTEQENIDSYLKDGRLKQPDDISFLEDFFTTVTSPDDMLAGQIKYKNKVIFEGEGGVFFVTMFGDVWASGKKGTANTIANSLNEQLKQNGGRAFLTLTKGTDSKLVSSASGVNSTLAVLNTMLDEGLISPSVFRAAVSKSVKKAKGSIDLRQSSKDLKIDIKKYFTNPKTSTFEKRGFIVKDIVADIAKNIDKSKQKEIAKLLGGDVSKNVGVGNTPKGVKGPGSQSLVDLIAKVAAEKLTKGLSVGDVYAVIEVNSEVEVKEDSHPSYPFHISLKDGSIPILHLPKNRKSGSKALVQKGSDGNYNLDYAVRNVSVVQAQYNNEAANKAVVEGEKRRAEKKSTPQSRKQRTESLAPNGKQRSRQQKIDKALSKASGTTQVATTTGSYVKAANILKNLDIKGEVLDFGAGLGLGTDAMSKTLGSKVDSYEINPERWKGDEPVTYTKVEDINKKYDAIVSLNVLNVVPKEIRDGIVQDIYSNLKPGGTAVISTRGFKGDINSAKNFELGPEEKSYIIKRKKDGGIVDVYQKGFDGNELVEYIQDILGDKVKVSNKGGFGSRGVIVQKLDGAIPKVAKATIQQNAMARKQKGLINFTEKDAIKFSKIGISDARTIQAMNSIGLSGVKFNKEGVDKKIKDSLNTLYKNYESYLLSSDSNEITRLMQFDIDTAEEDGLPDNIINQLKKNLNNDEARNRYMSNLIKTQDETANQWVSYFKESDYSDAFKYLMLDAVLTNNYDLKSLKYKKRTNTTTRNISPFDAGTLATLYASDSKNLLKSYVEIQQENLKNIINASKIKTTDKGKWLKFDGGPEATNIEETSNSLSQLVQDTYWCTKTNALGQLREGDFYVYVTGKTPRIAIRMEGNKVGEVRGNASSKQDLEGDMLPVAEKFLKNNIPNDSGKKWLNSISFNNKVKEFIENIKTNGIGEKEIIDYIDIVSESKKYNTDYGENAFVTKAKDIFASDKIKPEIRGLVAFDRRELDPNATKYLIGDADFTESNIKDLGKLEYIDGTARFNNSNIKSLGNLKSISGDAAFRDSNIKDLGNLESIGGDAYFRGSNVESLGKLEYIGGSADFRDSNVESLSNLEYIGSGAFFINSKVESLGKLESIGGNVYFRDSNIKSLGSLESIGGTAFFNNSNIKSLSNLKSISGGANFTESNIKDLGKLEYIGGAANFVESKVESLGNLKSIGGNANFRDSKVESLGNLKSIGGDANFTGSNIKSLSNLESIDGTADFVESKVESLGKLESISGTANFVDSNVESLGNLKSIGGNVYFGNSNIKDLGNLEYIGGTAYFDNSNVESLSNLKSISGDARFNNSNIKSLGNLESIGGSADFVNSKVESLGKLESIDGTAYFTNSNIKSLSNLESIGGDAYFLNSKVESLGNLKSISGDAAFGNSNIKDLGNLEYIGGTAYFTGSNVESLGKLESISGDAVFGNSKVDLEREWNNRQAKPATPQSRKQMAEEDTTTPQSTEDIIKDFNTQINKDFPDIYHPDGRLKSKPTRKADSEIIYKSLKEDGVVSGLKSMLSNYVKEKKESTKAGVQSVIDFMQNYVSNSKTILNILDKGKEGMFTNLFYNKINRMEESMTEGIFEKEKDVDSIINNILGGNKTYRKWKFSLGTKKIEINGITDKNSEGKRTPLQVNLNKEEAMNLYAMWLNTDGAESAKSSRELLERQGYTNEKIKKVKEFIGPEQVAIVEGIVDFLSSKVHSEIAPIYKNEMGEDFPKRENYFPRRAVRDIDLTDKSSGADFRSEFQQEYVTALKPLLNSESDLEVKGRSFLDVLENHIATTERFKAYAEGVRELSDVYNSADVQAILEETSTKPLLDIFLGLSINPNSGATGNNKFISTIYRNIQGYFLALNLQQALRQASSIVFGFTSYKFKRDGKKIPFRDILGFAYDISEVLATLPKQIKESKDISATFKKRIRKSLGGDIAGIESGGRVSPSKLIRSQGIKGKVGRGFSSAKGIFNAIGDIVGIMGYKAAYNRNIKNGMSKAEALEAFNKYNETQGSTRNTDKNRLQLTNEPILKAFTLFGSVVYLNLNNSVQAVNSIYKQILKRKPGKMEDYRKLVLNYSIGSGVYMATAHLPQLLSSDEEDREYALSKITEAMLGLNLLYKVPILGAALESMLSKFDSDGAINPIVTIVKDVKRDIKKAEKENKNDPKYIKAVSKTVIEFAAGAKSDAPIALYNLLVDDVDDKETAWYDAIGVSKSYRPGYGQKKSKGGGGFKGGGFKGGGFKGGG